MVQRTGRRQGRQASSVRSPHEYIAERRRFELRALLAEEARKPRAITAQDDLGELLTNITHIQIPIPQNPILSIFGKRRTSV